MNINQDLKNLINEEIKVLLLEQLAISEDMSSEQQKQVAVQNINKHLRLLKYLKSTIKQIKMPEQFQKISELLQQENTAQFLNQFLNVKDDIPVKIDAVLTNPLELIQAVTDEVIGNAYKNAKQKLSEAKEGELPFLGRDKDYYKVKHDQRLKKKGLMSPPPPTINNNVKEEIDEGSNTKIFNLIQKLEKKARQWESKAQEGEDKDYALQMAKTFADKAAELKGKFNI